MSLLEQQNFLARVYTDENLRRKFLAAPGKIGRENDLNESEISEILEIFPDEINRFAESLIWKRLQEVEKILPLTKQNLGADFIKFFREFAPTFNSTSVKKHLEDALAFAAFLQHQNLSPLAKNITKFERAKLEFYALRKNLVVRRFDFDIQNGEPKKHLKIWLRVGKKEFVF